MLTLPSARATQRVEVWRKLRRYGALPLRTSGYLLPNTPENQERFEWLATTVRRHKGKASVVQVQAIDDLPDDRLRQLFIEARSKDYESLLRDLKKIASGRQAVRLAAVRRRFQEISAIDFFNSPLRSRIEILLAKADESPNSPSSGRRSKKSFHHRLWVTRHRPGIDRVSSAWLIRRVIDPEAKFAFAHKPQEVAGAIPFDMFHTQEGFGHRGEDCTFETLVKEFAIRDPKVATIAQIIHDADLGDEKYAHSEGFGIDRVLIGWAQYGVADDEVLRRGMEIIDGLYHSL